MSGTSTVWPPPSPTTVQKVIPSYLYVQYNDDVNLQALVTAYNTLAQQYLDWFNQNPLGVYTNTLMTSPMGSFGFLDWVLEGLYGIYRPTLVFGSITSTGTPNTYEPDESPYAPNAFITTGGVSFYTTSDDIFKRILTWHFFKGDGQQFTIPWLKRRIKRFLIGTNGTAPNIGETYQISVTFESSTAVVINITWSNNITLSNAQIFQAAVASSVVELPFQFTWTVNLLGALTSLTNVSGNLHLVVASGWPTSATGLNAGQLWWDGTNIHVVTGSTPNPAISALTFGSITSLYLLLIGGANIQKTAPASGSGIIWNSSGILLIA